MVLVSKDYRLQKLRVTQVIDKFRKKRQDGSVNVEPIVKTATRGSLYSSDLDLLLNFQFNPTDIAINKRNIWEFRGYTGKHNVEPIWVRGDVKTVAFKLDFDATAGSTNIFAGGKVALLATDNETAEKQREAMEPRGVLDYIETLESFTYPQQDNASQPRFTNGVATLNKQFKPVPTVQFTYGNLVMWCKLTNLSYNYTAWSKNLIPLRADANVELTVIEGLILDTTI